MLQNPLLLDSTGCPFSISWNSDVATKASITEQPRRRRHRQREAPSLAATQTAHFFLYILYICMYLYMIFYYKYRAQMGPGSGGGVSCWSVPTQEEGWEGTHRGELAWISPTGTPVPMPGEEPSVGVKPVPGPVQ